MNSREILLYLSLIYKGDWDKIFDTFYKNKDEKIDEKAAQRLFSTVKSKYITIFDEEYPDILKQIVKPPFVLYYYGDISLLKSENLLAVVGTRKVSEYGIEATNYLVSSLAKDFVIVSGMAIGVDAVAHRTAINSGGRTIAVLGNGIDFCYLKDNQDIYSNCKEKNLVISEYPGKTPVNPLNFPIRNRIIAGLVNTLLVTEGTINSGTQITSLLVLEKGGNVCCVPARIFEESVCNELIANGAFLVEKPIDVYVAAGVTPRTSIFEK